MSLSYHELKHLPTKWIYYSDHDIRSGQIFTIIKVRAVATAHSSTQHTYPQSEWAGPTMKELIAHCPRANDPLQAKALGLIVQDQQQ